MKKKIFSFIMSFILCCSSIPVVLATDITTFSDVPASHWAFDEIEKAVDSGIVNGYADGTFKPAGTVTNAHFAAMIAREYYVNALEQLGALPEGRANWWYGGIAACDVNDILDGTKVGNQHESTGEWGSEVNVAMNRYDMAQVMYNLLRDQNATMPSSSEQTAAQDAIGDWENVPSNYRTAVAVCYALGLLNGQSDGTFGGQNNMNRAQACVVIDRLNQYIEDGTVNTGPGDVDDTTPPADTDVEEPEEQETETPATSGTLANGEPATEENVLTMLDELKEKYPDGSTYDAYNPPYQLKVAPYPRGIECAKYAYMISDEIFGTLPMRQTTIENLRPGDMIETPTHWSISLVGYGDVVSPTGKIVVQTTSGGPSGDISWADTSVTTGQNADYLAEHGAVVWTRYPD